MKQNRAVDDGEQVMPRGTLARNGTRAGCTADQFAVWMGVTRQTVYEWNRRKLIVKFADESIDPIASVRKVDEAMPQARTRVEPDGDDGDMRDVLALDIVDPSLRRLSKARLEHLQAMFRAEASRVELSVAKDRLIAVPDAARVFSKALAPAIDTIKNLPYRTAPRLVGMTDERRVIIALESEVNHALRTIAAIDPVGVLNSGSVPGHPLEVRGGMGDGKPDDDLGRDINAGAVFPGRVPVCPVADGVDESKPSGGMDSPAVGIPDRQNNNRRKRDRSKDR